MTLAMGRAFIKEDIIYRYMEIRSREGLLKVRKVIKEGRRVNNPSWERVNFLQPITDTFFPDVDGISLGKNNAIIPAEVKFITSKFAYHKPTDSRHNEYLFQKSRGLCVMVMKHDYMPNGLSAEELDVWEFDYHDFTAFCIDNFTLLLREQLDDSVGCRYILMHPGSENFYRKNDQQKIKPAIESGIWCPQTTFTGYDIAPGDRVLFVNSTRGWGPIQRPFLDERERLNQAGSRRRNWISRVPELVDDWKLKMFTICEVTSTIMSREEYCDLHKLPRETQLWNDDPLEGGNRVKWPRVFKFKTLYKFDINMKMSEIYDTNYGHTLVDKLTDFFRQSGAAHIVLDNQEYECFLQKIISNTQD